MYNSKLWETSGHWQNYKDDMFTLDVEKEKWALKPMNCPGHCLIFDSRDRSYKELPIRMAEFGILHRNEASGALTGLTRVRRFVQDDTHVFCMPSQIEEEIAALFDFMQHIYGLFGFEFALELSTRPENYLGQIETWNEAEAVCRFRLFARAFSYAERLTTCVLLSFSPATDEGAGQVLPRQVGAEPGRRRVLRPQDRHQDQGRAPAVLPVRDDPARLPAARALQP